MSLKEFIAYQRHQSIAHTMLSVQSSQQFQALPAKCSMPKLYKESCRCHVTQSTCSCSTEQVLAASKQLYHSC